MVPRRISGPIVFISVAQVTFVASLKPFFCFLVALGGVMVFLLPLPLLSTLLLPPLKLVIA